MPDFSFHFALCKQISIVENRLYAIIFCFSGEHTHALLVNKLVQHDSVSGYCDEKEFLVT